MPGNCHDNIRLGIAIDVAGEYTLLEKVSIFIKKFLGQYHIAPNQARVGVIAYADEAEILFRFQDETYQSLQEARNGIDQVLTRIQPQGRSLTEKALMKASDALFSGRYMNHHLRVLLVFTLGRSPNPQLYKVIVGNLEVMLQKR